MNGASVECILTKGQQHSATQNIWSHFVGRLRGGRVHTLYIFKGLLLQPIEVLQRSKERGKGEKMIQDIKGGYKTLRKTHGDPSILKVCSSSVLLSPALFPHRRSVIPSHDVSQNLCYFRTEPISQAYFLMHA